MAEVKNSFLKSRMNQDLDDRLIPNGEYRYASNISVGKSEADDIGALENVLGNEKLPLTVYSSESGIECIGSFMDNQNNRIYQFLTDYEDTGDSEPTDANFMQITVYDLGSTLSYSVLVSGVFLNFAKNKEFKITGVNLIEGLLFWTDNRNQPRKINIQRALDNPNYYTNETQISVAKYSPVDPISLYRKIEGTVDTVTSTTEIVLADATGITAGMTVVSNTIAGSEYILVISVDVNTVYLYSAPSTAIIAGDVLTFLGSTMSDKSNDINWPGDPNFLEDKYVRFSYRFRYDDNEYSLMAPFTQIAYIPKQKGFFIDGNETDAYRSTIINWFENNINNIELLVPLPDSANNIANSYKITELDVLYKESDSTAVKVLETIPVQSIAAKSGVSNVFIQPYQSQKPYKTLSEDQTVRVYDRVPVRAKAQETAGNRIIYGNYFDKYTPPSTINYNTTIQPKSDINTNFIEYPNHTLKQNRNYQVGFVLSDKFGRQSPVILSTVDDLTVTSGDTSFGGSTVYSKYDIYEETVRSWFGNALILIVNSPITSEKDLSAGTPGLYATPTNSLGFVISEGYISGNEYTFTIDEDYIGTDFKPEVGDWMRGSLTDYVEVTDVQPGGFLGQWIVTTTGPVNFIYEYQDLGVGVPDTKFAYTINPIGWYSYKVVVRQQQQDYYNVYLPGMLNGYPVAQTYGSQVSYSGGVASLENGINTTSFPVGETNKTAHVVLINDNINKVPRDLSEVGPDQKQYRSSVQLYGRVENVADTSITITGHTPSFSSITNTITYDAGDPDYALVKPGDGIQCAQATTTLWYANTVVVSNEVVGTVGTITFEPANPVLGSTPGPAYVTFPITRAENKQYYPTRKADTVTSIASANEFNFLSNTVDNIRGTSGLNFYQLQNKPLIGRISTVDRIGTVAEDMIPFLSIYETAADESLLDLFWETSTTGLISDLNADVSTGYDGPIGFTTINYDHSESLPGVSFITDEFQPKNSSGIPLGSTIMNIASIIDGTGANRTADFELFKTGGGTVAASYRIKTANTFVFNHNAPLKESYTFTFNVTLVDYVDPSNNISTQLSFTGRLKNDTPIIDDSVTSFNITQTATTINAFIGANGSYSSATTGLQWLITSGDTDYFGIDTFTGVLSLLTNTVPIGSYDLQIKLTDAVDSTTNPPYGSLLVNADPNYASKYTTLNITVNVGSEPVPYFLRQNLAELNIFNSDGTSNIESPTPYPYKYGIAYVGNKDITLDSNGQNTNLPTAPDSLGKYQSAVNMEIANGLQLDPPISVIPVGLTQGTLRWNVSVRVNKPDNAPPPNYTSRADCGIIVYYRDQTTPGGAWTIVEDDNNAGFTTTWDEDITGVRATNSTEPTQIRTTTFTTTNPDIDISGEWAIAVRLYDYGSPSVYPINTATVTCEDANFSYNPLDYTTPITTPYTYYTGLEYYNSISGITYPTGVPYETQDAERGMSYNPPANIVSTATLISGTTWNVVLQTANQQLASGMLISVPLGGGELQQVISSTEIIVDLNIGASISAGDTINISDGGNTEHGVVYSISSEGTGVRQFYVDSALTEVWIPPVANRFYNFWAGLSKDYNDGDSVTNHPFFCAKFDENGSVVEQITPAFDVQTYANGANSGRNLYGYVGAAPV
jgi:hypothetical protein